MKIKMTTHISIIINYIVVRMTGSLPFPPLIECITTHIITSSSLIYVWNETFKTCETLNILLDKVSMFKNVEDFSGFDMLIVLIKAFSFKILCHVGGILTDLFYWMFPSKPVDSATFYWFKYQSIGMYTNLCIEMCL